MVISLMTSNDIIRLSLHLSVLPFLCVCFIFSSCGLASSVGQGVQCMAMVGSGLYPSNLETPSRDPVQSQEGL